MLLSCGHDICWFCGSVYKAESIHTCSPPSEYTWMGKPVTKEEFEKHMGPVGTDGVYGSQRSLGSGEVLSIAANHERRCVRGKA